jgi:hypothetical protein
VRLITGGGEAFKETHFSRFSLYLTYDVSVRTFLFFDQIKLSLCFETFYDPFRCITIIKKLLIIDDFSLFCSNNANLHFILRVILK